MNKFYKGLLICALIGVIAACSTRKDKFINRQFQALNTKYNALYNGELALDKGLEDVRLKYRDNFWDILTVERMQDELPTDQATKQTNANFERAELKATKAIQKRSMNIDGKERNPQIDEAHLLLGKARYFDQRYIPALEAFNYILYKYPESDKIYEAKIWRERTNMRLENDALAVKNLKQLLKEIKFKDQVFAEANATIAQAYLKLNEIDSAAVRLAKAIEFTKKDEEKARYHFILGQLYAKQGKIELSNTEFQTVIDMKRKSPRRYIIQAEMKLLSQFNQESGDTIAFVKHFKDLINDRENRPFLDVLYHNKALYYAKQKNYRQALENYSKSLDANSEDDYLVASNYRNMAGIYFDTAKYQMAGQYFDSTLTKLPPRTREYKAIEKKRLNLDDVIKYEGIAQQNDSILNVVALSEDGRKSYYEAYIEKLKKSDAEKAKKEKAAAEKAARLAESGSDDTSDDAGGARVAVRKNDQAGGNTLRDSKDGSSKINSTKPDQKTSAPVKTGTSASGPKDGFYFYNSVNVAVGKSEFKKKWGNRTLRDNWRFASLTQNKSEELLAESGKDSTSNKKIEIEKAENPAYKTTFYTARIPSSKTVIDSLAKARNFAYFQLGAIYKDKFKEYRLSANRYERLLQNNPEERFILPALYNLYKDYLEIDPAKAAAMKQRVIAEFPQSRYAEMLQNTDANFQNGLMAGEDVYNELYAVLEKGDYIKLAPKIDAAIRQYTGEEIVPKLELLKARNTGKLNGISAYKSALNFVALNYPTTSEGKEAEELLRTDVPIIEDMEYDDFKPTSYKVIYPIDDPESELAKSIAAKLETFAKERTTDALKFSVDIYTPTAHFFVLHNFDSEAKAKDVATILKEYKDYKIPLKETVISTENYKVTQVKKNFHTYHLPRQPRVKKPVVIKPKDTPKNSASPVAAKPRANKSQASTKQGPGMPPGVNPALNQKNNSKSKPSQGISPDNSDDPVNGSEQPQTSKDRKP